MMRVSVAVRFSAVQVPAAQVPLGQSASTTQVSPPRALHPVLVRTSASHVPVGSVMPITNVTGMRYQSVSRRPTDGSSPPLHSPSTQVSPGSQSASTEHVALTL
jgi:hypothetical protein